MIGLSNAITIRISVLSKQATANLKKIAKRMDNFTAKLKKYRYGLTRAGIAMSIMGGALSLFLRKATMSFLEITQYMTPLGQKVIALTGKFTLFQTVLAEALTPILTVLIDLLIGVMNWFLSLDPMTQKLVAGFLAFITAALLVGGQILILAGILGGLSGMFSGIVKGLGLVAGALTTFGRKVIEVILQSSLWAKLVTVFGTVFEAVKSMLLGFAGRILPYFTKQNLLAFAQIALGLGLLYVAWKENWLGIGDIVDTVVKLLMGLMNDLIQAMIKVTEIAFGLADVLSMGGFGGMLGDYRGALKELSAWTSRAQLAGMSEYDKWAAGVRGTGGAKGGGSVSSTVNITAPAINTELDFKQIMDEVNRELLNEFQSMTGGKTV